MPGAISREEVQRLQAEGAQLVEVLSAKAYEQQGHLPGAINIPLSELDGKSAAKLNPGRPVIVYCYDSQ